ncbi:MAG: ArsR/SmtB family transcription factor [Promethearchaeota archaeon]
MVFRNPIRADILKQLSESPQRPKKIADDFGMKKQSLNYHLNALKREGLIQTHTEELTEKEIPQEKGTRINGVANDGKLKVSYGIELTKNGKNIFNQFIDPLYEEEGKKRKKEDD